MTTATPPRKAPGGMWWGRRWTDTRGRSAIATILAGGLWSVSGEVKPNYGTTVGRWGAPTRAGEPSWFVQRRPRFFPILTGVGRDRNAPRGATAFDFPRGRFWIKVSGRP